MVNPNKNCRQENWTWVPNKEKIVIDYVITRKGIKMIQQMITEEGKERIPFRVINNKKRSHTELDSRKQVIAFQDRVITINIKEAQHPLK